MLSLAVLVVQKLDLSQHCHVVTKSGRWHAEV